MHTQGGETWRTFWRPYRGVESTSLKPDEPEDALTWSLTGPERHLQAHSSLLICKCGPYSTPTQGHYENREKRLPQTQGQG